MYFHFIPGSSGHWALMTLYTGICIEQRPKTILRFEFSLEDFLPLFELCSLLPLETGEWLANIRVLR